MDNILQFKKQKIDPSEILKSLQKEIDEKLIADIYIVALHIDGTTSTSMTGTLKELCFASAVLQTHIQNIINEGGINEESSK